MQRRLMGDGGDGPVPDTLWKINEITRHHGIAFTFIAFGAEGSLQASW
jgi:hypothetical protein